MNHFKVKIRLAKMRFYVVILFIAILLSIAFGEDDLTWEEYKVRKLIKSGKYN